jgi:hypothetical protein
MDPDSNQDIDESGFNQQDGQGDDGLDQDELNQEGDGENLDEY